MKPSYVVFFLCGAASRFLCDGVRAYYSHARLRSPWAPSFHAVAAVEAARRGVPRFGSNAVNRPISGK